MTNSNKQTDHKEISEKFCHMGDCLRRWRNKRGLLRSELAELSHVSLRYLQQIEHGTANPTLPILQQICTALEVNVVEVLAEYFQEEMAAYIAAHPQVVHAKAICARQRAMRGLPVK